MIVHSDDGDRWEHPSETATSEDLRTVAWGGGRFVAVGRNGTIVHSRDGAIWETSDQAALDGLGQLVWNGARFDVAWGGGRFVAVAGYTILHSRDGAHWEETGASGTADVLRDVAFSNGRFVAVGWNGTIVTSP